jgi:serine/threonine protein kinase
MHETIQQALAREQQRQQSIASRYTLLEQLGQGGFGVVWRARDAHFDRDVAIKFIDNQGGDATQQWREASMLRRTGLATGARLLDEGVHAGWPFIVMELIEGDPFPGPLPDDENERMALKCTRARALLSELARLHAAGLVHSDLKPNNALIERETGRLVLLDFGLSRILGHESGAKNSRREGTPVYMSPEQLRAQRGLPASDLYAVGVILFELFAGRPPHDASSITALMRERLMQEAPSLAEHAPETPEAFITLVDALLEREPSARPASAERALEIVASEKPSRELLPIHALLELEGVIARLEAGESIDLGGISGADGRRVLSMLRRAWESSGGTWRSIAPGGKSPLSALIETFSIEVPGGASLEQVKTLATSALEGACKTGDLLVCEEVDTLDLWSARLLEQARRELRILRAVPGSGDFTIEPISPASLETIFHGPEAGYRLRSDAAHELYLRTGGLPDAVERELAGWEERGLAWQTEQGWTCDREGLDWLARHGQPLAPSAARSEPDEFVFRDLLARLALVRQRIALEELILLMGQPRWEVEALLEELERRRIIARARGEITALVRLGSDELTRTRAELLVDRLPRQSRTRIRVLLEHPGITSVSLVEDVILVANKLDEDGFSHQALTLLEEASITSRQDRSEEDLVELLRAMTRIALASPSVSQIERLLRTMQSAELEGHPVIEELEELAELARESCRKPGSEVITALEELGEQDDPILELRRRMYMVRAGLWSQDERLERIIEDADAWASELPDIPEARATSAGWLGQLAYTSGDYERSSQLHAFAAENKRRRSARIASQLGRVWALLDGDRGAEAAEVVEEVAREARACRHHAYELQALQLARWVAYRNGALPETDDDLLDAIGLMGNIEFEARTFIIEAAVCWRRGDFTTALDYATRGADCWVMSGMTAGATLCQALAMAIRVEMNEAIEAEEHARWCERASEVRAPLLALQALGLLASVAPLGQELRDWMREAAQKLDAPGRAKRREIISIDEALEMASVTL